MQFMLEANTERCDKLWTYEVIWYYQNGPLPETPTWKNLSHWLHQQGDAYMR